ncbi:ATP-binding protein [Maritalea mediterranea]|uniref:histidine kinase n=1 Tax=Maritalea mediterranea TaxID=2909667 RepID=A0ABS9E634_9HYPH|nr:ATP-binding protein [Maritalea mediterranea]MCF4097364.1 ATP-binding protein [Maritalea mediterranea]
MNEAGSFKDGFLNYLPGAYSVWGRLFASFLLISAILAIIAFAAVLRFTTISQDMSELVEQQMPEIVQVNEVATAVTELAAQATILSEPRLRKDRAAYQEALNAQLTNLSDRISRVRDPELITARDEIEEHIRLLLQFSDRQFSLEENLIAKGASLRWLQADFQSEISPLLLDISFNIDNAVSRIEASQGQEDFRQAFNLLSTESAKRDLVQEIGREGSFAINAMLQSTNAQSAESLAQFADISLESLDHARRLLDELGEADTLITLEQSLNSLRDLATSQSGIFAVARQLIEARKNVLLELAAAQQSLSQFQKELSETGETRRATAIGLADEAIRDMQDASLQIVALTITGLMATSFILIFYVRRRVVARLQALSHALRAIARGELNQSTAEMAGTDELGRMGNAVEVFRQSVIEREETLNRLQSEIRERERTNKKLQQTQVELVQAGKLAALGRLSAGISHELNQPIAATRYAAHNGLTRLEQGADAKTLEKPLQKIVRLADRMTALVKQFSHFARRSDYDIKPIALWPVVERSIEIFQARLVDMPHIEIKAAQSSLEQDVLGDQLLVEQVLVNLISNAIDAIEDARPITGQICISGRNDGSYFMIDVTDNGAGLPDLDHDIFEPFVTSKEVGKGTGLGLSISYTIAQDLGGVLYLKNNEQQGATASLGLKTAR